MTADEYMGKLQELIDGGLKGDRTAQLASDILLTLKGSILAGPKHLDRLSDAVEQACDQNLRVMYAGRN